MEKLEETAVYETSWYFIVSTCVPTSDEELVKKVRIWEPKLVKTVTQVGVVLLSFIEKEVKPQIEYVLDEPYYLFTESFKKGYVIVFELPSKYTNELVYATVLIASYVVLEQGSTKLTAIVEVYEQLPPQDVVCAKYTVVPASDKSVEYIVSEVGQTDVSQAKEFTDVYVPDKVLLQVIVTVDVISHAEDYVNVESATVQIESQIVQLVVLSMVKVVVGLFI